LVFAVLFGFAASISAVCKPPQSDRAFSGVVYASSGVPVIGAIVVASSSEGDGTATTDSLGNYLIEEDLKPDVYTVFADATG